MDKRSELSPFPPFSKDSPWNQEVPEQATNEHPCGHAIAKQVACQLAGTDEQPLDPAKSKNGLYINSEWYSVPIFDAAPLQRSSVRLDDQDKQGDLPWASPTVQHETGDTMYALGIPHALHDLRSARGSDRHLILLEHGPQVTSYEFWDAHVCGRQVGSAGTVARFSLRGEGTQGGSCEPKGSARGTGVPLLAGLLTPESFPAGEAPLIPHALAFAVPELRYLIKETNHVYPASKPEKHEPDTDLNQIAPGQRIRLKDVLHTWGGTRIESEKDVFPPAAQAVLRALRTYGAYASDQAGAFTLFAEDPYTAPFAPTPSQFKCLTGIEYEGRAGSSPWLELIEVIRDTFYRNLCFAYTDLRTQKVAFNFTVVKDTLPPGRPAPGSH